MPTIAIIGAGSMGRAHARAWAAIGHGGDIRYVVAPAPARTLPGAEGARSIPDIAVVLRDAEVDVVSVCTPTDSHADIAARALSAGKNVLLEKPLAVTVEEGAMLRDVAAASPGILMVAHVVRFFPGYRRLRALVDSGTLGAVRAVRACRIAAAAPLPPWFADEARSGGMLVDLGVHDFDQLGQFLALPETVGAAELPGGTVHTTVGYAGGAVGQVVTEFGMPQGFPFTTSLEVMGELGVARYHSTARGSGPGGPSVLDVVTADGPTSMDIEPGDPFAEQARYFLGCVASGTPPADGSAEDSLTALTLALAARASLRAGTRLPVAAVAAGDGRSRARHG